MAEVLPSEELVEEPSDYGALQPGMRLGRYEMLVPIARGGMARVWAARLHGQRGFQKLVAIKVILPHLAEEPEFERMFLDEARIASGMHHPNVCEIYELGEEKRTLYLVMEWVNGDSFSRILRATGKPEAIDPRVVARVVADASAGVHAAHEQTDDDGRPLGVVHRDLSPHNILVSADGTAKVCDFGVAKALGQLHEATSAGQLKGKISYMAPEQITGTTVDRRSDVFSLGCVLYEATTGLRPFRGEGDHQVMHAVLKGEIEPPTSIIRSYPAELERIVLRALAPTPLLRFPTAERMRFALEEFLARGQVITQANVAQVVRARIGESLDRRRERIRQASAERGEPARSNNDPRDAPAFRDAYANLTPSPASHAPSGGDHRSGIKPSANFAAAGAVKPQFTTLQMDRPEAVSQLASVPPPAASSRPPLPSGIPRSTVMMGANPSSTPPPMSRSPSAHSYPGASYSQPQHPLAGTVPLGSVAPFSPTPPPPPVSAAPAPSHAPTPVQIGQPAPAPQGAGHYAIAVAVGVLIAVIIAAGGWLAWRRGHEPMSVGTVVPPTQAPPSAPVSLVPVPVPVPDSPSLPSSLPPPVAIETTEAPPKDPSPAVTASSAPAAPTSTTKKHREPKDPAVPANPY